MGVAIGKNDLDLLGQIERQRSPSHTWMGGPSSESRCLKTSLRFSPAYFRPVKISRPSRVEKIPEVKIPVRSNFSFEGMTKIYIELNDSESETLSEFGKGNLVLLLREQLSRKGYLVVDTSSEADAPPRFLNGGGHMAFWRELTVYGAKREIETCALAAGIHNVGIVHNRTRVRPNGCLGDMKPQAPNAISGGRT